MDGGKTGLGEDRLLADRHHQRAHAARRLAPLRGQAKEGERQGLDGFGDDADGAQSAASVPPSRLDGKPPSPGTHHDVGGDVGKRQHAAAIDEDAEFGRQRPKRGLAGEHGFDVARDGVRVEGGGGIVGPKRARHDIADGFERRVGTGETCADDGLGEVFAPSEG